MSALCNRGQSVGRRTSVRSNLSSRVLELTSGRPFVSGSSKIFVPGQSGSSMLSTETVVSGQSFGADVGTENLGEGDESEEEVQGLEGEGSHLV